MSFHMVVPWIGAPIPKTQVSWPNAIKEALFLHFLCPSVKNSNGRQSDNFGPRGDAYGPSESLCPKFSETPLRKSKIFKIEGVMPLQSQVIPICVTQNSCFFGIFWEKMLSHGQTVHFWPHSVTHIQKAVHLRIQKIRLKFDFRHPVERQIFGDGGGLDPALILALCLISKTSTTTTSITDGHRTDGRTNKTISEGWQLQHHSIVQLYVHACACEGRGPTIQDNSDWWNAMLTV